MCVDGLIPFENAKYVDAKISHWFRKCLHVDTCGLGLKVICLELMNIVGVVVVVNTLLL